MRTHVGPAPMSKQPSVTRDEDIYICCESKEGVKVKSRKWKNKSHKNTGKQSSNLKIKKLPRLNYIYNDYFTHMIKYRLVSRNLK